MSVAPTGFERRCASTADARAAVSPPTPNPREATVLSLRTFRKAVVVSLLPITASAQGLVSTGAVNNGVNDLRWFVSTGLVSGPMSTFTPAFLIDVDPTTPGYQTPG